MIWNLVLHVGIDYFEIPISTGSQVGLFIARHPTTTFSTSRAAAFGASLNSVSLRVINV